MKDSEVVGAQPALLSNDEFASLREVGVGEAQGDIPQVHWERLVALGYALRRLGTLQLTESGKRRIAVGIVQSDSKIVGCDKRHVRPENDQGDFEKDLNR